MSESLHRVIFQALTYCSSHQTPVVDASKYICDKVEAHIAASDPDAHKDAPIQWTPETVKAFNEMPPHTASMATPVPGALAQPNPGASHTPGPFRASQGTEGEPERWCVVQDRGVPFMIAVIENGAPGDYLETEEANAKLFAAAPDLLEACKSAYEWSHFHGDDCEGKSGDCVDEIFDSTVGCTCFIGKCYAAIKKATEG